MMDLTKYLLDACKLHPSLAPQDVVKLCYQAAFGAEHMLSDMNRAKDYFQDEYDATPVVDRPLAEYISPTVCRVNIAAWKKLKLEPNWLWNLFASSAAVPSYDLSGNVIENGIAQFDDFIAQADKLSELEKFTFSYTQWQDYISTYREAGVAPVRHSARYSDKEKPAYRIISGQNSKLIPIFAAMSGLNKGIIAIDGRAASGKTTLTDNLCDIINAGVVRMDDFFLPPEMKTAERMAEPGGNVHYERFIEEVLPHLSRMHSGQRNCDMRLQSVSEGGFQYRKFDCSRMEYSDTLCEVQARPWYIVEGVYSHHPMLGNYSDIRVFMDIHPKVQISRIKNRNMLQIAEKYFDSWIPMEEAYFKTYNVCEAADVVIHGNHF